MHVRMHKYTHEYTYTCAACLYTGRGGGGGGRAQDIWLFAWKKKRKFLVEEDEKTNKHTARQT